jgi:HSP20 family protein
MSLIKWEPLREFESIFDRYAKALRWPASQGQELLSTSDWSPSVDISERNKEFVIKAEIPNVKKEDVKVSMDHGILTIQGEKKQEEEKSDEKYHRVESYYGKFIRSFSLPDNVDENNIQASYKDGILNLHIPKKAESKPKSIEVTVQ